MGIIKDYMNQTRKPEGILGKMMILGMNMGHAGMAKWGTSFLDVKLPEQIVDLGCGVGSNLMALALKYPGSTVTGVDYSPLSVKKSKEKNKVLIAAGKCSVQQGDVSALTLADETFDLATAYETIYFLAGLEKCFAEVARVLKPDGTFMIVNEADGYDAATKKYEDIIDGMKVYTPEQIKAALLGAGFKEVKNISTRKEAVDHCYSKKKEMGINNITFVQGDVGALPFADGSFDAVVSLNGFHAFPDKEAAYSETYRVLKPGGTFSGCFYVKDSNKHTDKMISRFYIKSGFFTPPFETAESLRHRLEGMYDDVEVYTVESIAVFKARKR